MTKGNAGVKRHKSNPSVQVPTFPSLVLPLLHSPTFAHDESYAKL